MAEATYEIHKKARSFFLPRPFIFGICGGLLLLFTIFTALWFRGPLIVEDLEDRLAQTRIEIGTTQKIAQEASKKQTDSAGITDLEETASVQAEPATQETPEIPQPEAASPEEFESIPVPAQVAGSVSLAEAPFPGLFETTPEGFLPVIDKRDNTTPFNAYAQLFEDQGNAPLVSIAIRDFGLSETLSSRILSLPAAVTPILSPYSPRAEDWQKAAREDGHEFWLHAPMEQLTYPLNDPGPLAIMSGDMIEPNLERLKKIMGSAAGYPGIAIETNRRFESNSLMLTNIITALFDRGLGIAEINAAAPELSQKAAESENAPFVKTAIDIDDPRWGRDIGAALTVIESRARNGEHVFAVMTPTPASLEALEQWIATLPDKNIRIAPLSAIAARSQKAAIGN